MACCAVIVAVIIVFLIFGAKANDIEFPTEENFQPNDVTERPVVKYGMTIICKQ